MALTDCGRVAEIRVAGWRSAYRGLIPDSYLDALDATADAERHRSRITGSHEGVGNIVAERAGKPVGWACHGPYREGGVRTADAELYALYVAPGHCGDGIGPALLQESVRRCAAVGNRRMLLWVLKGNTCARRFYERAGFRPDGTEEAFEADGVSVPEVRYVRELEPWA
jgi:GNAT superfamily N-acetyltransferase